MGRKIRTLVPQVDNLLIPEWTYMEMFKKNNQQFKQKQQRDYNKRHCTKELKPLPENTDIWITSGDKPVQRRILSSGETPHSYVVDNPTGQVWRNRSHLNLIPESPRIQEESDRIVYQISDSRTPDKPETQSPPRQIMTRSRTGTTIHIPDGLRP